MKKTLKPNPKKDKSARRVRPAKAAPHRMYITSNAPCTECRIRPRRNGSSRCEKCTKPRS